MEERILRIAITVVLIAVVGVLVFIVVSAGTSNGDSGSGETAMVRG